MKIYKLTLLSVFIIASVNKLKADNEIRTKSSISSATVYLSQAKITRETEVTLKPGNNDVILEHITTTANAQSLQVQIKGNATLLSASYRINYVANEEAPVRTKQLRDSLEMLKHEIGRLEDRISAMRSEKNLLEENRKLGSTEEGMKVEDLKALTAFYRQRNQGIMDRLFELRTEKRKLEKNKTRIQRELNQVQVNVGEQTGEITIKVNAKSAGKVKLRCTYLSTAARWIPLYDLRADKLEDGMKLVAKGHVSQQTGYDWKNIKLTLSTGNPSVNNDPPYLSTLYCNFDYPRTYKTRSVGSATRGAYSDDGWGDDYEEEAAFDELKEKTVVTSSNESLSRGAPKKMDWRSANSAAVVTKQTTVTTAYEITTLQNIPSDKQQHLVSIKDYELSATYKYLTIPKMDQKAYLEALTPDWGKYDLLSGKANIFFQGMYVGQSYIDSEVSMDTLHISMGRDEQVKVDYKQLTDFSSKKIIGLNRKETYAFEINVRNNKAKSIALTVKDQIPVSQNKDIEIALLEDAGASYNEVTGMLEWDLEIESNSSKKLKFSYSIKYPKNKKIRGVK